MWVRRQTLAQYRCKETGEVGKHASGTVIRRDSGPPQQWTPRGPQENGELLAVASQHNWRLVGEPRASIPALPQCLIAAADNVQLPVAQIGKMMIAVPQVQSLVGVKWKTLVKMMSLNGALPLPTRKMESGIEPGRHRFAALADEEIVPVRTRRSQRSVTHCATLLDSGSGAPLLSGTVSGQLDALI